jgi:hypothetical protein
MASFVSTVAGKHKSTCPPGAAVTSTHADGRALSAQFSRPAAIDVMPCGCVLISENGNHCIRKLSADRTAVSTVAGVAGRRGHKDGLVAAALFDRPAGIRALPSGAILVCDFGNSCLRLVSADGASVSTVAGAAGADDWVDGPAAEARFSYPCCPTMLPGGAGILVSDQGNHCVRLLSADLATVSTVAGHPRDDGGYRDGAAAEAEFRYPRGMEVLGDGRVLVCDSGNSCVRVLSADMRRVATAAGEPGESGHRDGAALGGARFGLGVCALTRMPDASVLVSDHGNHCLRRITPDLSAVSTVAGRPGVSGFADGPSGVGGALLNSPAGIHTLACGSVVFNDAANCCVRMLSAANAATPVTAELPVGAGGWAAAGAAAAVGGPPAGASGSAAFAGHDTGRHLDGDDAFDELLDDLAKVIIPVVGEGGGEEEEGGKHIEFASEQASDTQMADW